MAIKLESGHVKECGPLDGSVMQLCPTLSAVNIQRWMESAYHGVAAEYLDKGVSFKMNKILIKIYMYSVANATGSPVFPTETNWYGVPVIEDNTLPDCVIYCGPNVPANHGSK